MKVAVFNLLIVVAFYFWMQSAGYPEKSVSLTLWSVGVANVIGYCQGLFEGRAMARKARFKPPF